MSSKSHLGFNFEFDEERGAITYSCDCHDDFEQTIHGCKVSENMPIRDIQDLVDALNGLDYQDIIDMHGKFTN